MTESTTRSETSPPIETPKPDETPREGSRLERLKAIFDDDAGESPPSAEAGESHENAEAETGDKPKGKKPKSLKDLAERLAISDADLYDVEVPLPNGKPVKLGALKDAHAKQDEYTVRELAFEERVARQEADWTRSQQELTSLVSQLDPKTIKPEIREKVRLHVERELKRERELTLKTIPQWQDESTRERELSGMVELLKDYGIGEQYLLGAMNHKLFRFVRDSYLRKLRVEKALAKVEPVKRASTTGRSSPNGAPAKTADAPRATRKSALRERVLGVLK